MSGEPKSLMPQPCQRTAFTLGRSPNLLISVWKSEQSLLREARKTGLPFVALVQFHCGSQ